jgi:DNA-binding response OmpR family regulator
MDRRPVALIVDDCHFVTRRVARALVARGFECVVAADGYAGLEFLRSQRFDLFVLDIDMPMLNGFSLLQHLRHDPVHATAPVLMLSDEDSDADREQAIAFGASGYMTKPLQLRPLYAMIDSITS